MFAVVTSLLVAVLHIPMMIVGLFLFPFMLLANSLMNGRRTCRELTDKDVVLVTGCDSGFGLATVRRLQKAYARCQIVAALVDDASPVAAKLRDEGIVCVRLNFCEPATIEQCAQLVKDIFRSGPAGRRLHAVVSNAGVCMMGELDWMTPDQIGRLVNVNATGPVLLVRALMDQILDDRTRLVFVSSMASAAVWPYFSVYSMSKAALEQFVRCLRLELAPRGVAVVVVRPGNFTAGTDILAHQDALAKDMWNAMDDKKRQRNGDFWHMNTVVRQAHLLTAEDDISPVVSALETAITAAAPPAVIEVSSWNMRVLQFLFSVAPTSWMYPAFSYVVTAYLAVGKIVCRERAVPIATDQGAA